MNRERKSAAATPITAKPPKARTGGEVEAIAMAPKPAMSVTEVIVMLREIEVMARTTISR